MKHYTFFGFYDVRSAHFVMSDVGAVRCAHQMGPLKCKVTILHAVVSDDAIWQWKMFELHCKLHKNPFRIEWNISLAVIHDAMPSSVWSMGQGANKRFNSFAFGEHQTLRSLPFDRQWKLARLLCQISNETENRKWKLRDILFSKIYFFFNARALHIFLSQIADVAATKPNANVRYDFLSPVPADVAINPWASTNRINICYFVGCTNKWLCRVPTFIQRNGIGPKMMQPNETRVHINGSDKYFTYFSLIFLSLRGIASLRYYLLEFSVYVRIDIGTAPTLYR